MGERGGWGQLDSAGLGCFPGRSPEMRQTATSCAGDQQHGTGMKAGKPREKEAQSQGLCRDQRSGVELTWASRVSSGAGVPGTSSAPTLGRSQETSGVGPPTEPSTLEWQEIGRVRGRRASPQETALQPLTPSLCPLRDDQCRPKHPRGRRVTATRRLHLTGHAMAGEGAMGRSQDRTHRPPHSACALESQPHPASHLCASVSGRSPCSHRWISGSGRRS